MIIDALKPLLESGLLTKETQQAISEAWDAKLIEAKNELRSEIRNEFAERYAHDKTQIEESLDKIVNETLQSQVNELQTEKLKITKDRTRAIKEMQETAKTFKKFLTKTLAEEIQEFRKDKIKFANANSKLEKFVISSLAEEITEFAIDKQDVANVKVKLVKEAKGQLSNLKKKFVARASKAVNEMVTKTLQKELTQLHEDITAAKKNNFGRKIYETFAAEFAASYLNENAEMRKINSKLQAAKKKLAESTANNSKAIKLLERKERQIKRINEDASRNTIITELTNTLVKDKSVIMTQLLESVPTANLRSAFDKYLPAVLETPRGKKVLNETKTVTEVTGNKTKTVHLQDQNEADGLTEIKRLAGL